MLKRLDKFVRCGEKMKNDVENLQKGQQSPVGYMYDCLCWYCYFTKLDRAGIKEVATALEGKEVPPPEETEDKKCSCLELAAYFEKEADKIGAQMETSRKKFDYGALKQSYKECINI